MPEVNREVAESEFERLAAGADVDIDITNMSEDETEELADLRDDFVSAIVDGRLSVNDEGQAVLVVKDGDPIRFRVPLGADLMIMASANDDRRMEGMVRFVCSLTGQSTVRIGKLGVKEWKLAMRIAGFLSAA